MSGGYDDWQDTPNLIAAITSLESTIEILDASLRQFSANYPFPVAELATEVDYAFTATSGSNNMDTITFSETEDCCIRKLSLSLSKTISTPTPNYNSDILVLVATEEGSVVFRGTLCQNQLNAIGPSAGNKYYVTREIILNDVFVPAGDETYISIIYQGITIGSILKAYFNYIKEIPTI